MAANDATSAAPTAVQRNPKDSMKSTWRDGDRKNWTHYHWFFERWNLHPSDANHKAPVFSKTQKVPYIPDWELHVWVLAHAFVPLIVQQLYVMYFKKNMHPVAAAGLYIVAFKLIGLHQVQQLRRIGVVYGYLDGDKHARDEVPDVGVKKVYWSLSMTSTLRSLMAVVLSYRRSQTPMEMNWLALPVEVGLYGVVLDFWFYWYHRVMHDFDGFWKYHRTHHLTKHPNPLLTLYADGEQEFFDILGVPLMTFFTLRFMGLPMGFYEWWICQIYVVFAELSGHSGIRVAATPPSTVTWLLRYFDTDLSIEDHDLHHRTGWKKSHNYGKQTRLWDRIFGTCADRIELVKDNIDYENKATMFVGMPWSKV